MLHMFILVPCIILILYILIYEEHSYVTSLQEMEIVSCLLIIAQYLCGFMFFIAIFKFLLFSGILSHLLKGSSKLR